MSNEFSVYQYFVGDDRPEVEARFVDAETAVNKFAHFTHSAGVTLGIVARVIITDGGDFVCMEWLKDKGVTFPPELRGIDLSRRKPKGGATPPGMLAK